MRWVRKHQGRYRCALKRVKRWLDDNNVKCGRENPLCMFALSKYGLVLTEKDVVDWFVEKIRMGEFDGWAKSDMREGKPIRDKVVYEDHIDSPEWRKVRKKVLERDGHRCTVCGKNINLHVHHLSYKHLGYEMEFMDDLTTLCRDCHGDIHDRLKKIRGRVKK